MRQGYRCGALVFSPSVYPSLHFAFHCLTNGFMCVCPLVRECVYVCVGVDIDMKMLMYGSTEYVCVSLQPEERNGPQRQTTTHTVADPSEVIVSNSKQTTGYYHTDAASVQMWVLMKVHLVPNTINSFRTASRIMICSLVQHSPESLGITAIVNESAVHDSCWSHSLKGNSDLQTCVFVLLYRSGNANSLKNCFSEQCKPSLSESFNAINLVYLSLTENKGRNLLLKNPCAANFILIIRGLWSRVQSKVLFLDSEFQWRQ